MVIWHGFTNVFLQKNKIYFEKIGECDTIYIKIFNKRIIMKILSPAGNFESLKTAVYNGADEVYLGINHFNARNNIDGFTMDNLQSAVDFAHVYGVKVLLAINILFLDCELQSALDTVITAFNMGVDAFIVQDLGLIKILSEKYPQIELHASTQMGIHNLEGVKFVEKFGIKRVVLSRETPLKEIKRIKENSSVEIEYFVHGALCVSFSGNCYLSSYMLSASGNRGKCKQLCRLPYTLKKQGKVLKEGYLLSAKDFNMSEKIQQLIDAGVDVVKIEGRARRPYYVGAVTREYRRLLDEKFIDQDTLKLAFNRGYTAGYFDGNGEIISDLQNHIGIFIGKVYKVEYGKNFNRVFFTSNRELNKKSTFKVFSDGKERSVVTAYDLNKSNDGYVLTTTQKIKAGDSLNLISDAVREQEMASFIKKRHIKIEICAVVDKPITAHFNIDGQSVKVTGEILQKAQKQPLTKKDFLDNFSKSEYFDAEILFKEFDQFFLLKAKLNDFRRQVFSAVYTTLTDKFRRNLSTTKIVVSKNVTQLKDFQIVESLSENFLAKNIIYSPEIYDQKDVENFKIKCEKLNKCAYLDMPNFALYEDVRLLKNIIEKTGVKIVANNYYALLFDAEKVIGGGLNVYNSVTANYYDLPFIASETAIVKQTDFAVMTFRHCPLKAHINASCNRCPFEDGYEYVMDNGKRLKIKRKKLTSCTFYLFS